MKRVLFSLLILTSITLSKTLSDDIPEFVSNLFTSYTATDAHVAVLPFETTESHNDGDLGVAFAEFLISDIVANKRAALVDRTKLTAIIQEQTLSESGMIDENDMIELGKLASADFLITGKIVKAMGSYLVTAQLVNTESSKILGASKMTLPISSTNDEVTKLFETHNYPVESAMRSLLVPGWGQFYAGEKGHGILAASLCGIGVAATVTTGVMQHNQDVNYKAYSRLQGDEYLEEQQRIMDSLSISAGEADLVYEEIQNDMYSEYESKRTAFAISAGITGGLWALNVIDAIFMGKRAERKYQLYFSSNPITETYSATVAINF